MGTSSNRGWLDDFWGFYRAYARTGIHAATAVAVTVGFGLSTFGWWYAAAGLACYVLPLVYLYATGYTPHDSGDIATSASETQGTTPTRSERSNTEPSNDAKHTEDRSKTSGTPSTDTEQAEDRPTSSTAETSDEATRSEGRLAGASAGAERADDQSKPSNGATSDDHDDSAEWTEAESFVETALLDVTMAGTRPYAAGAAGVVLARRPDDWEAVIEAGPSAESNTLRGIDATDEGAHVWFVGDSGALGLYDTDAERLTDYSAPEDRTSTWADCAVVGEAGAERLFLVNGSGEVVRGENDDGAITWDEGQKPGSGSSIAAIAFAGEVGACCDTSGGVFATTDGGKSYTRIGVEDTSATFTDLAVVDSERMVVACDDGSVIRYDGARWTRRPVGEVALAAIDRTQSRGLAAGARGSVHEHADGGWTACETPTETDLAGVAVGEGATDRDILDVAVGADGTVIER